MLTIGLQAQIQVTTVSSEIKGSGGLSLDENGNLIIADFGDFLSVVDPDGLPNDIHIMDPDFNITQYSTGFIGASGNDFDSNGVLFQSDIRASAIYKIIGGVRTFVTSTGIVAPVGIVFDSQDNFYVCNCGNNTIRKVTPGGVSTDFAPSGLYQCPNGITVDEDDNLYVSNFNNGNIIKITPAGDASVLNSTPGGSTGGASNGHLDYFEPTRTLFIASHGSNQIYMMSIDDPSDLVVIAGSGLRGNADGDASTASFSRPNGVAVTKTGDSIYINSAVPVTNIPNGPLNPQLIRLVTGVNSILSVNETEEYSDLIVFPNPATDRFTLEVSLSNEYLELNIKIYDIQGRILKERTRINTQGMQIKETMEVSELSSGNYFYSLNDGNKQLLNGKIIIQ
jgi:sugar lactone lactonase YvrE